MASRTPLTIPESDPRACSRGARVNALARVPFFAGLDHDALHRIDERADMHAMDEGAAVYLAGRAAQRLYVLATGAVKLTVATGDGDEVLLDVLGPGSFLGTLPSLGGTAYAEDAWALTGGCLLSFPAVRFEAVLDEHPAVTRQALAAVGARLQAAQERITRGAAGSAAARIAATLLVLGERLGAERDGRIVLDVPLSREDLASLAGCAPETASRHLSAWKRDGVVDTGRRWVAIRRPDLLAETAGVTTTLQVPTRA
ncbi:MAG: Crp/Fnr family transcriptional regulator [Actinobacteria bacterium]|jgi:CRP-like cAMP-binding protein|nr:Crp/Fnr family transcriptional regulator [Actinomycetota bacterium]